MEFKLKQLKLTSSEFEVLMTTNYHKTNSKLSRPSAGPIFMWGWTNAPPQLNKITSICLKILFYTL